MRVCACSPDQLHRAALIVAKDVNATPAECERIGLIAAKFADTLRTIVHSDVTDSLSRSR